MSEPAAWLVAHRHLLPPGGEALEIACGRGLNALWLAGQGFTTLAVDRDRDALDSLEDAARRRGLALRVEVMDLELGPPFPPPHSFDLIVGVHYLHRALFPALLAALRPGGVLVYETFTRAQAARGRPTNPAFLLDPGELLRLAGPLEILASREGDFDGRMIASVVARRTT